MQALLIALAGALAFAQESVETAESPGGARNLDLVIRAGRVHVGDGRVLQNMRIRIRDGKVVDLIKDEGRLAPGAEVLDYRRHNVMPGLVAAHTDLCAIDNERNLTPDIVAADNFDYYHKYDKLVAAGLTTVYLSPGLSRLMPGRGSVVKLAGEDVEARLLRASSAVRVHLSAQSRRRIPMLFEPTPMPTSDDPLLPAERQRGSARYSQLAVLEEALDQARSDGESELASLREVLSGSLPVRLAAERGADVLHGLDLFSKLGAHVILERPEEALPLKQRLARQAVPVVVKMPLRPSTVTVGDHPLETDPTTATPDQAGELSQAGIPVCIVPASDKDLRKLRMIAGLAARYGMSEAKAIAAVTIEAARVLGVADRVGSIEAGKDADLLVLTGRPFDSRSQVDAVFIDGDRVHERRKKRLVYAIRAGRVLLGDGTQQHDSTVVVRGGKIDDVGPHVPVPPGARVYSYPNAVLTPGFIAAATKLGLHADSGTSVRAGPEVDVASALEADDPAFRPALEAGITSLFVTPDDGSSASGRIAAVKTDGSEKRFVTRAVTGLRYVLSKGGKAGKAKILAAIKKARDYIEPKKPEKKPEPKKGEKKDAKEKAKPGEKKKGEPKKPVDPISGKWQTQVVIQGMPARVIATMKLQGTELSCTLNITAGPITLPPIELTGSFKDNKLELEGTGPPPVGTIRIEGTLADKKITGKIKGGGQEIDFVAVRIDEEEKEEPVAKETKKKKKKVKKNESLEPYRPILAGEAPLVVRVTNREAAEAAIQAVVVESKLKLVLTGAARDLAKKPLELPGGKEIGFLLGVQEIGYEEKGDYVDVATALADQGFEIILANRVQKGTRYLPVHAAYAVSTGFDPRRALESITGAAARSFGLEERIGLLARGRDADLVLLSGDPFDLPTRVLGVWVNGVLRVDRRANANPEASGEKR